MDPIATPLPPGATIGILGGGQLGRMLALAAARLGLKTHIYSNELGPAFDVATFKTTGPYEDLGRVRAFAETVDVVTYEFENIPLGAAAATAAVAPIRPNPKALEVAQDRLIEKRYVKGLALPVAPFAAVYSAENLASAITEVGTPAILKSARFGYDGKGQVRISNDVQNTDSIAKIYDQLSGAPAIFERFVDFEYEISILLVRSDTGEIKVYDPPQNTHRDGILRTSLVPAPLPASASKRAIEIAATLAQSLDYIGVLAIEMFYLGDGATEPLIVNEFAPRVHNSGHWTIDACTTSQFENHIRAVAGWPLGQTARHSNARMTNLVGDEVNDWPRLATEIGTCVHLYGKDEARPGRKMGHVTKLSPLTATNSVKSG